MKTLVMLICAGLLAANSSVANDNAPVTKQTTKYSVTDTIIVPVAIRTTFNSKYPTATRVIWYKYTPDPIRPEPTAWNYYMDPDDYYVTFVMDDADYVAWYDNGQWIRSSQTLMVTELPIAVQNAIKSQYPGFVITDIDFETDNKQSVYEVDLESGAQRWKVHYNAAGAVVKKKPRNSTTAQPVEAMATDFESRYPNATEVVWYRYAPEDRVDVFPTDWDYTMDATDYEVRFRSDGVDYVAYYDNGAWIRSETTVFDPLRLPASVNTAISKSYPGYKITDVDREETATQILYEVELENATEKCKIHYTVDGNMAKKKCRKGS